MVFFSAFVVLEFLMITQRNTGRSAAQ